MGSEKRLRADVPAIRAGADIAYWQQVSILSAYLSILAAITVLRWTKLDFDEAAFYVPAIRFVAARLPAFNLNYPFPAPPAGLYIQAILYRIKPENFGFIKCFSLACSLSTGGSVWYLVSRENPRFFAWNTFLMVTCFPFLLNCAFQLKQHELTIASLILGYACWCHWPVRYDYRSLFGAGLFFIIAAGTNQFAIVLPAALGITVFLKSRRRIRLPEIFVCAAPAFMLLALFLVWKGPQPPLYRGGLLERDVGVLSLRFGHVAAAMLTIGAWLFPVLRITSRDLKIALWALLPSIVLIHLSGLYRVSGDFYSALVGPVSSFLRVISLHSYPLCLIFAGAIAACGVARTASLSKDTDGNLSVFAVYTGLFLVIINFVPYYFESYYLYLIVPAYLLLLPQLTAAHRYRTARAGQILAGLFGITFSILKAIERAG
jgi:hypothetical protein